jgi:2-hydroxy-3-oxopropionate reductase
MRCIMTSATTRVALLGSGIMGSRMAFRLLDAGYPLAVWNRSPAKTAPLAARGAFAAATAADACANADIVITMLSDGPSVAAVVFDSGAAASLTRGSLLIDMSSIAPREARDHGTRLAAAGVGHLDAPVSGGPSGAEQGTLAIMVGGTPENFARARPLLERLGRPTLVGPPGSGALAKLCNQIIVALTIGAVAEALLLARMCGADPGKVREALTGGFADSLVLQVHGRRMLDRSFAPGGASRLQLKDLHSILATAADAGLTLPLAGHVAKLYESLVANGGAELDHSALMIELERLNEPLTPKTPG